MTAKSKPRTKRKPRAKPKSKQPNKPPNEPEDFPLETSGDWTDEHTKVIGQLLADLDGKPPRPQPANRK